MSAFLLMPPPRITGWSSTLPILISSARSFGSTSPGSGTISGLRGVHLQCHIGTDTMSLARLGASMTGLDFSAPAVQQAQRLADRIGADARFVEADVYSAADVLGRRRF